MEEELKKKVLSHVNKERVVKLLQDMVKIPSYTGEEWEIAQFMANWLEQQGLEVDLQECTPTKYHKKSANVIAILRGTGGGMNLMLNGHMDTDPACGDWKYDPWDPVIFDGNKMNGIGTTNMKGGDSAMVEAVLAIKDAGIKLKGDILITLVCEELQGGWGISKVLEEYTADAGINTEPTYLTMGFNPAPGISRAQVQVYGKTAHIHELDKAVNATTKLAKVMTALDKLTFPYTRRIAPPKHPKFGLPVMAVSACRSGIGEDFYDGRPATVGDRAIVKMDIRYDNNQSEEMVYKDIQNLLNRLEAKDPELKTKLEPIPTYITRPPYELPWNSFIVQVLKRAHKEAFGKDVKRGPTLGGHDGAFMWTQTKIPTVIYGLGGGSQKDPSMVVDTSDLFIYLHELHNLAKVLSLCCLEVCNTPKG
jgi:acetylornithine deacetylase/succinyl-diaminopimelate desuccinylase-like protein